MIMAVGIESINTFVDVMLDSEKKFEKGLQMYQDKQEQIQQIFNELKEKSADLTQQSQKENKSKEMLELRRKTVSVLNACIENGTSAILESGKGMSFIQKHEKTFVVSVFGKVKSGKSSLGNFIMGTELKRLGIPSNYDKLNMEVSVEDRGNISVSSRLEIYEDDGFGVGSTETTSTIQYFQIGGLTWFDTPGIGSITKENEELAKEYIQNSDLVIFTCSSDAAGTQQEFSEMKRLSEMKKPVLLLVTMSDTYEEDEDEDGNIIKELLPKSDKDRKDVEDYLIRSIREQGLDDILQYSDVMTISKQLAVEALKIGNDEKYKQSNMDSFLEKLISITQNEAAQMKLATPLNRIYTMIDTIIGSEQSEKSLIGLRKTIQSNIQDIDHQEKELVLKREAILSMIKSESLNRIQVLISGFRNQIIKGSRSVSSSAISKEIVSIIADVTKEISQRELSDFMSENTAQLFQNMQTGGFSIPDMKMQTESISYQQEYVERCRRSPKGIFENISSFIFNTEYYENRTRTVTKTNTFDVGINESEVLNAVNSQIQVYFADNVNPQIEELIDAYFRPIKELQKSFIALIDETVRQLKQLKTT